MQAVIGAGGSSSRFYPLSNGIHKSMVKILGKPILEYTIEGLKKAGIKDLVIITSPDSPIKSYFGNGERFGVSIKYVIQPQAMGAGNAILRAKNFVDGDFIFLNASHLDIELFATKLIKKGKGKNNVVLLAKEKDNTWDNGVIKVEGNKVLDLVEKPQKDTEPSKLCVLGVYLLTKDFLIELDRTPPEHYQLEKSLASFAKKGVVEFIEVKDESVSLKYPWDLLSLKNFLLKNIKKSIGNNCKIAKSAEIEGDVIIGDGVEILEGAKIKGPCFIGKNSMIGNNAILRSGVDIGENCVVGANMEIKNSIIMDGSKTHSGFIGDSIIGENCRIAAQFCTANRRLDRGTINAIVKGEKVGSGFKFLGVIIGSNVSIGIKSSSMPGIIVGNGAVIGPSTVIKSNVPDKAKYYTKFEEVILENEKQ